MKKGSKDANATVVEALPKRRAGALRWMNLHCPWLKFGVPVAVIFWVLALVIGQQGAPRVEPRGDVYGALELRPVPIFRERDLTGKKLVALTFDDGPAAATTRLLEILERKQVRATFFVVGSRARNNPELLRREAANHEVGSHTMWHTQLTTLNAGAVKADAAEAQKVFREILGREFELMRPPYGSTNGTVRSATGEAMILWSIDPQDWLYRDAKTVRRNVVEAAFDGAVILLHDIHASTVEAVPGIIEDLWARGYEFVTISELAEIRGVELKGGVLYGSFGP